MYLDKMTSLDNHTPFQMLYEAILLAAIFILPKAICLSAISRNFHSNQASITMPPKNMGWNIDGKSLLKQLN